MKNLFMASAGLLAIGACSNEPAEDVAETSATTEIARTAEVETVASDRAELGDWGIVLEDMDMAVDPGDDFFRYVNGNWLDRFEIPAEFSNYGSFTVLFERSEARVKSIIEDAAASNARDGSIEQKIGDYYASYLDTDAINEKGLAPI